MTYEERRAHLRAAIEAVKLVGRTHATLGESDLGLINRVMGGLCLQGRGHPQSLHWLCEVVRENITTDEYTNLMLPPLKEDPATPTTNRDWASATHLDQEHVLQLLVNQQIRLRDDCRRASSAGLAELETSLRRRAVASDGAVRVLIGAQSDRT